MDALTLVLSLLLVGGALALILYPLWQQTRPEALFRVNRSGQTFEEYQARYQAALAAIKDLIFDYEMGKVLSADYELLLTRAKLEAANIRQKMDRLSSGNDIAPALDAEIEALIANMRQGELDGNKALLDDVEAEIDLLKEFEVQAAETVACPNCGKALQSDDVFCSRCGHSLPEVAWEPEEACPNCGYAVQPDDAFCVKCGAALEEPTELTATKQQQAEAIKE